MAQEVAATNAQAQNQQVAATNAEPQNPIPTPAGDDEEVLELGNLKSDVWKHFTKIKKGELIKAKCNYCKKLLAGESNNGTSHLRNHLRTCMQKRIQDGKQKVLGTNFVSKGKREMVATQFNQAVSKQDLAVAIIMHEYSLSIVDHLYFRKFLSGLQPLFSVPTRNTIKTEILKIFESERSRLMKMVGSNKGRVAITTDMWTASNQKKGYMAITAHYVDNSWILRNHILRFAYVPTPHTSGRLAKVLLD
ncbi:unnamed protein product [Linum tenue]|uniref:BED-type domain-containing protein n=1 Tax=Linum tenue TaxID=586396 RepID=A0AAV0RJX6_9ROSI|nr:unnamed protein product [Linum tenue]